MPRTIESYVLQAAIPAALLAATACSSTVTSVQRSSALKVRARWVMLPISNFSDTPQAGERIEAMLETMLRKGGVVSLDRYPPIKDDETHLMVGDRQRYEESLSWAHQQRFDYGVAGSVEEWRYKSGLEGEPAVGLSVRIVDLRTDRVLWSGSGSRTGGGGENASGTALRVLDALLSEMSLSQ